MFTDEELVRRLSRGEEQAYSYLFDRYYNILCKLSMYYVRDHYAARGIVVDVIYKLWKNRANALLIQDLRRYLLRSVKNRSLNYLEQQRRYRDLKLRVKEKMESEVASDRYYYPLDTLLEQEADLKLQRALDSLPGQTREIFEMSRFEKLKYHEISERTGLSVDSVKYHIKRALSAIRKNIGLILIE